MVQNRQPGLNWLERAVAWLSPSWGRTRLVAKLQAEELASYRGARHSRLGRAVPGGGRADYHLESTYDRRELVDRARQLERSSVIAEGLLSRATENVVGCGFKLQAQSNNPRWNDRVEAQFTDWADYEADVRGLSPLDELLALTYRSWLRDGDVGTLLLSDGRLQTVESDQIANPHGGSFPTKEMVDGIKLDSRGRPVSYYVVHDPDPLFNQVRFGNDFTEVPAENVLFLARRQRIGQTRGLSAFSGISWLLDAIDGHIEAVTAAARMAACMGLVVARKGRMSGLSESTNSAGDAARTLTFEPGMLWELDEGDEVTQIKTEHQAELGEFLSTLGRLVGLSFGLPLEVAFLDFSRTNYSSARAALLQAHQVWQCHQKMLSRYMGRIYRWWLVEEMRAGRIPTRSDALRHSWITPGWKWVDPEKELKAQMGAVDAGLSTLHDVATSQGKDFAELVEVRRREVQMIREAGLPEVRSSLTRDPAPAVAQEAQAQEKAEEMRRLTVEELTVHRREEADRHEERMAAMIAALGNGSRNTVEIHQPPPPVVNVEAPQIHMAAPDMLPPDVHVHVPEQPAPVVNVTVPEQGPPVVNVAAPVVHVAAPEVAITNEIQAPEGRSVSIRRGPDGRIVGADVE